MAANNRNDRNEYISFRKKGGYNTPDYYRYNRELGKDPSRYNQEQSFSENENDELNTGKYENYNNNGGYYGSNYGSINNVNTGRDYEQNAGYRSHYKDLDDDRGTQQDPAKWRTKPQGNQENKVSFRGKGPRSYQRSDVRITEDINDRLYEDVYLDASDVEVTVTNGEVTLSGIVDDRNAKRRAEDICEHVSGVKHVENRLRSRKPGGQIVNIQNSSK